MAIYSTDDVEVRRVRIAQADLDVIDQLARDNEISRALQLRKLVRDSVERIKANQLKRSIALKEEFGDFPDIDT